MSLGKIAVVVVALAFAVGGIGTALADRSSGDGAAIELTDDARRGEPDDEIAVAQEDDGDGDDTRGDDGTAGGANTGDGDPTRGNDGTSGGDNTGDGDATAGNDGTAGGANTGDGDWTGGNDGTGGGDNSGAPAPAPAYGGDDSGGGGTDG